jgi:hypothetical protein
VIFAFAVAMNAPLEAQANPGLSPNPAKAPWYFMGLQELLVHFHPLVAVLAIPLAAALLLLRLPALDATSATEGPWFISRRGRRTAASGAIVGALVTLAGVLLDEYALDLPGRFPSIPSLVTAGLIPVVTFAAIGWLFLMWLKRREGATPAERTQALCTALLAAMIVLTIIGAGFRGRGMALTLPYATSSTGSERACCTIRESAKCHSEASGASEESANRKLSDSSQWIERTRGIRQVVLQQIPPRALRALVGMTVGKGVSESGNMPETAWR